MDIISVVDKLDAEGYIRKSRVIGDYYQIHCPFHNNGNERKPSFGIRITSEYKGGRMYPQGFCHCFTCGFSKDLKSMLTELFQSRHISISALEWLKLNVPDFEVDSEFESLIPDSLSECITNKFAIQNIQSRTHSQIEYVSEEELKKYRYTVPYMYQRKLTDDIICKYDIGYDANWIPPGRTKPAPCITFPVRDVQGRTLFLCRRTIEGKMYNYPEGVTKPVYGIDMIPSGSSRVCICESCINALTLVSWGYVAVALLGTGNSYQIDQLKQLGVSEFIICTDGDEAGRRSASKLKKALKSNALVWIVPIPDGKDVNDLSEEEFREVYEHRE